MNTPTDIARRQVASARTQQARNSKRAAWEALKRHTPEFIPTVREVSERFGISGVRVTTDESVTTWEAMQGRGND